MKYRVAFAVLAVLAFHLCSYSGFLALVEFVRDNHDRYEDEVTRYEKRFEGVRAQLPDHGTVGYRTDPPQEPTAGSSFEYVAYGITWRMDGKKSYLLTQYVLAPVIVDRTREYPLVVENGKTGVRVVRTEGQ
jgi:hypothetical protein